MGGGHWKRPVNRMYSYNYQVDFKSRVALSCVTLQDTWNEARALAVLQQLTQSDSTVQYYSSGHFVLGTWRAEGDYAIGPILV
jgi:hypothetical protein